MFRRESQEILLITSRDYNRIDFLLIIETSLFIVSFTDWGNIFLLEEFQRH